MVKSYLEHCKKPQGFRGRKILKGMNEHHAPLHEWVLDSATWEDGMKVLDIGCGGGGNIYRMFQKYPHCKIDGIDYSEQSVKFSQKKNAARCRRGECEIKQGNVMQLPYPAESYDVAIAIETVYFWPDVPAAFLQIKKILKLGGKLIIGCELDEPEAGRKYTQQCEGMTIYPGEQLKEMLEQAGFQASLKRKKEWICVEGIKTI